MKFIKKTIAVALCAIMMLSLFASCNGSDSANSKKPSDNKASVSSKSGAADDSKISEPIKAEDMKVRPESADKQVKNLKILPVGDSITFGIGSLSGWRYAAYKELYAAGVTFEFVGPDTSSWDYRLPARYNKHGSNSGRTIQNVIDLSDSIFNREFDAVMLMIGYNDKAAIDSRYDLYRSLVNKIYSYNPKATVFCIGVAPDYGGGLEFTKFNKFIQSMCEEMKASGKETYYVSTATGKLDPNTCFTDFVHPNEQGNAVLGELIAKGTKDVLLKMNTADNSYTLPKTVKSLKLSDSEISLTKHACHGDTYQLKATLDPTDAEVKEVVWATSDSMVAKVDSNGIVTANGEGTCYITAASLNGGHSQTCKVTVKKDSAKGQTLLNCNFDTSEGWTGAVNRITLGRFGVPSVENTSRNFISSEKEYDLGNKFIMSFNVQVFEILNIIQNKKPDNYSSLVYGDIELKVFDHERGAAVYCNGKEVCRYDAEYYSTDPLTYGIIYDNGNVTLTCEGAAVASGKAEHTAKPSVVTVIDNELDRGFNARNVTLIKY